MKSVQNYLDHAKECRQLAARARTQEEKEMILRMEATWNDLAEFRNKQLAKNMIPTES